ncbi:MAG: hypothetical protein RL630_2132 [Verrucomicrobiota bacterium]|jgi:predicted YcjX-like family ATPase
MKSILLISDTLLDLAALGASYSPVGIVDIQSQQRIVVEGAWGWFALNQEPEAEAEMDEVELAQIRRSFTTPFSSNLNFHHRGQWMLLYPILMPKCHFLLIMISE